MSAGIDYGMGKTNIDTETGIRYGVISQNDVLQAWADDSEAQYGDPTCPSCGAETVSTDEHEFYCNSCDEAHEAEACYGDEPIGFTYREDGYQAWTCLDNDIMIAKSNYYTMARFCSPCVPGAGNLNDHDEDGVKTYCFGHDWFDGGKAPYPVYEVATGKLVEPADASPPEAA